MNARGGYLPLDWAAEQRRAAEMEASITIAACDALDLFCDRLEGLGIVLRDTTADHLVADLIAAALKTVEGFDDE